VFVSAVNPLELVARTTIVYAVFILVLRAFGKRELGQFTIFDLALLLLAANALQPAMTGPDTSVLGGLVILATIFALNWLTAMVRERVPFARRLLESAPTVLARDGAWLDAAVQAEDVDQDDLDAALREHGIDRIEDAQLVVLEGDGSISVVPKESDQEALRRRRRIRGRRV
jgi:uncharacterized membrane protein YcaP (DUF421 family)